MQQKDTAHQVMQTVLTVSVEFKVVNYINIAIKTAKVWSNETLLS